MIKIKENYVFKCTYDKDSLEEMNILKSSLSDIKDAYVKADEMAKASKILKEHRSDCVCSVPLCHTIEARSLGASIVVDEVSTPRAKDYKYNSIDELLEMEKVDVNSGIIKEVLNSVSKLASENENAVLNVEGPVTVLTSLIDLTKVIKAMRKRKEDLEKILEFIKNLIVDYSLAGVEAGAKIISYADPTGGMDILGEKTYQKLNSEITLNILKELQEKIGDRAIVHVCGKTTSSLLNLELIKINEVDFDKDISYGEALLELSDKKIGLIGQNCIKRTKTNVSKTKVYSVEIL